MSTENPNDTDQTLADGMSGGDETQATIGDGGDNEYVSEESAKKQSPLVVVGMARLALAAGGYLWYSHSGPAGASAAEPAVDDASQTVSKFLDGGKANVAMMEKMLRDTEKVVQQFLNYPSMKQVPLADLHTNPFRFRVENADTGKPNESEAAAKRRREEERQAVLKAVGDLNLQSVMNGSRKSCMINNALYSEGEQINGFIVEKINPGTVIVKNGVYRFELRMQGK